jgi:two-component system CheB/CheR fusion protein
MNREVRILLLEDSPSDAELIKRELRRAGIEFNWLRVETRGAFTSALRDFMPDLVLSDNALPSFDALSALAIVRQTQPETSFIVVSGTVGEEHAVEMLKHGVTDYVLKDNLNRLGPVVRRALAETEQRREAREANERFRSVFEFAPSGMAVVGLDGRLLQVNDALCALLGRTEHDLLLSTVTSLSHPVDRAETSGAFESLLAGQGPAKPTEEQFLHGDGHTMWVLLGVSLITDADKRPLHFVAQFLDITAEKEAEARRAQFLSHVSHELRSPLAVVHQFASLLVDGVGGPLTPDQEEILVVLMRNVGQLRVMIDDLLEVTRADSGRLQVTCLPLALDDVLTEATAGYIWIAKNSRIGLFLEYEDLPIVVADAQRLREIIANLLDNALRFTPEGGQVSVEAVPQGEFVCVTVRDTGRGIRPEHMDRIFERFFQVDQRDKESRSGLGLGLPICRELVERQGGLIWATSELGKGTAVSFTIPILTEQDATVAG